MFAGDPAPFVMELPAYHRPSVGNVLREHGSGWSFIKRAGTIILASAVVLWFLQSFCVVDSVFQMVEDNNTSLLGNRKLCRSHICASGVWKLESGRLQHLQD